MFCTLSPTLSMSVHNVLSKHLGGLHRLPLRMVLTVANRASCAGVSVGIRKQCPRRRSLDCCMSIERGLDFVSLYNCIYIATIQIYIKVLGECYIQ